MRVESCDSTFSASRPVGACELPLGLALLNRFSANILDGDSTHSCAFRSGSSGHCRVQFRNGCFQYVRFVATYGPCINFTTFRTSQRESFQNSPLSRRRCGKSVLRLDGLKYCSVLILVPPPLLKIQTKVM